MPEIFTNASPMGAGLGLPMATGAVPPMPMGQAPMIMTPQYDERYLLDRFDKKKREAMEYRWIWEREWLRDLYYVANRQWITFHPTRREWVDKRLPKWVPKPVTNKMAETVQAIRTTLGSINLSVVVRPVAHDSKSIATAEIADKMSPLIHEEHMMNQVMREADFWLITTGNSCLQTSWDKDVRFNKTFIPHEQCMGCGAVSSPKAIVDAGQKCPTCGSPQFQPAKDQSGQPVGEFISFGKGKTSALSPFEYAFAPNITRFDEIPYIIRLRFREKDYYEANHPDLVPKIIWEKSPSDRSLQLFKSLALANDIGTGSQMGYLGASGSQTVEGVTEYEIWERPTPEFPGGFVMRVAGDKNPILVPSPEEGLPGPIPYKDIEGNPLFPFAHAQYEHMGGRLYGRSAIAPVIHKQDQLNQLDSLVQLCIQRTSNPVWVIPENAGIENITGEPGLVIKWNVLAANGQGKPERVQGEEIPQSLFAFREQILKDMEELTGTYDVIKGQKPTGVEAFSALQLLVERSQSRFTSVFQARGEMYRKWFNLALELERQYGPEQRVWTVVGPNKGYTFQHFENSQLQSAVTFQIEDGSNMPKTALGKRAAVEQANQLGLIDPADPGQRHALMAMFGLTDLIPSLDIHVQSALQIQDAFERWIENPVGPPPLTLKPWHDPQIHWNERVKWLNGDKMREILLKTPELEPVIALHLQELQMAMAPPVDPETGEPIEPDGAPGQGGGMAATNSNKNSASTSSVPKGNNDKTAQNQGPM